MSATKVSTKEAYQFAAEPKPVKSRSKYRGPNEPRLPDSRNLENDPRVQPSLNVPYNIINNNLLKNKVASSISNIGAKASEKNIKEDNAPENNFAPLSERSIHDENRITPYYYVDRPPTPEFKPLEPGVDVSTQVEDVELFDFVLEVEPILQVLVGKTIEQAQTELREEDDRIDQMRRKMRFDKKRNAELMVTQRKEALHLRKEDEKKRRAKQYAIEKDDKISIHKKYISRLLAKNITFGMGNSSINVLADQGILCLKLKNEMRKDYIPCLLQNTMLFKAESSMVQDAIRVLMHDITSTWFIAHAKSVQAEFDRLKKIEDDKKAEAARIEAERKRRRERRRKLRLYFAKTNLLNRIQSTMINRPVEVDNVFNAEITDIFPTSKESRNKMLATIGGLLGELWLVLEIFKTEKNIEIDLERLISIFIDILNEKLKTRDLSIYLSDEYQALVDEVNAQMSEDLIQFNQNKSAKLEELANQILQINLNQNLTTLYSETLLDSNLFNQLNHALLYIYFTSVDYKIPEKKAKEPEAAPSGEPGAEGGEGETKPAEGEEQTKPPETTTIEGEQPAAATQDENTDNINTNNEQPQEPQEEEFKLPEVTPLEQAMVQAKKKIKMNFVKDWEFNNECEAIVRVKIPLSREVKQSKNQLEVVQQQEKEEEKQEKLPSHRERRRQEKQQAAKPVEEPQEDIKEKAKRLLANDDYIEPFDGTTYEKDKLEFPEQQIPAETPIKVYNPSLADNKYIAQINEYGQVMLRKELISLIKQHFEEWRELEDETLLASIASKYKRNEKIVLGSLISDPENIPIFDIENI